MGVMLEEQETIINTHRTSDTAEIWTSDSTMITKLDRRVKENPETWKCVKVERSRDDGRVVAKEYRCPKKMISFRGKVMTGRGGGNAGALRAWREAQDKAIEHYEETLGAIKEIDLGEI